MKNVQNQIISANTHKINIYFEKYFLEVEIILYF